MDSGGSIKERLTISFIPSHRAACLPHCSITYFLGCDPYALLYPPIDTVCLSPPSHFLPHNITHKLWPINAPDKE